jgi:hypothetical protein
MEERFVTGQRVSLRSFPEKRGEINIPFGLRGGYYYYDVLWDSGSLETIVEHDLVEEIRNPSAWDVLANNLLTD